jgi:DNA-binding response OmpR family regulator
VIVVTASIGSLTEKKARQLGVTDYLLKPFDLDDLLKTVKNVLKE